MVLVFDFRMHIARELFRGLFGRNADGLSSADIDESCGHFAPVTKLESALPEAAAGDHPDGVGGAAVDLNESNEALSVLAMRVIDLQFLQAQHGQAHSEDLSRAQVSVSEFCVAQVFVEGFHRNSQLSVVGAQ